MMNRLAIALIRFYQIAISPLLGNHCRFYPSCSVYALQAFEKYGFWQGLKRSFWRICRCQPFCKGGFDPLK